MVALATDTTEVSSITIIIPGTTANNVSHGLFVSGRVVPNSGEPPRDGLETEVMDAPAVIKFLTRRIPHMTK